MGSHFQSEPHHFLPSLQLYYLHSMDQPRSRNTELLLQWYVWIHTDLAAVFVPDLHLDNHDLHYLSQLKLPHCYETNWEQCSQGACNTNTPVI